MSPETLGSLERTQFDVFSASRQNLTEPAANVIRAVGHGTAQPLGINGLESVEERKKEWLPTLDLFEILRPKSLCSLLRRVERDAPGLCAILSRRALGAKFNLDDNVVVVLALLQKCAGVPMSLADGCLVRMSETMDDPLILTTDSDFRIYRRHSGQVLPILCPQ